MKTKVSLKVQVDSTLETLKRMKGLSTMDVLVGVPEENAPREGDEINNAQLVAFHSKGVRADEMIADMGVGKNEIAEKYSKALSLYIESKGSPLWKIPPRPIIEPAIEASGNKERIAENLKVVVGFMLDGNKAEAVRALHIAGLDAVNMIKDWFRDPRNNWPDISPITKARKGSDQILVDTGKMRDAITYVVNAEE